MKPERPPFPPRVGDICASYKQLSETDYGYDMLRFYTEQAAKEEIKAAFEGIPGLSYEITAAWRCSTDHSPTLFMHGTITSTILGI